MTTSAEYQQWLIELGLTEDEEVKSPNYQQWLREAGLADEDADRLAETLENVESPAWMKDLSLEELFALAYGEEINDENDDSENED